MKEFANFTRHLLADGYRVFVGELPSELRFTPAMFDALWQMQPSTCAPERFRFPGSNNPT